MDAFDGIEIDYVVVAGDSVGYYFWPKEVIRLLRDIGAQIIAGNHEHMLIRSLTDSNYLHKITKKYGSGIVRALESFDVDEIEFWFENEGSWKVKEPRVRITNLSSYVQDKYQQTAHLRIISDDDCSCGN